MPRAACVLIGLLLSGCGGSDTKLAQTTETLNSWGKSIDMVQEQWAKHLVPRTYVRQMVKAGNEALTKQQKQISKVSSKEPGKTEEARAAASRLHSKIHDLEKNMAEEPDESPS